MELDYKKGLPIFTVDLEAWNHALHIDAHGVWSNESCDYLLNILKKYNVKAIFYVLGRFKEEYPKIVERLISEGHTYGWHGHYHDHLDPGPDECDLYRSPYWDYTPMPGLSGGFFMRFLPYWLFKKELGNSGILFIHPHDIMINHPKLGNWLLNLKRQWGLKNARYKLEKVLREVKFGDPKEILEKSKKDIHLLAMERRHMWRWIWNFRNRLHKSLCS